MLLRFQPVSRHLVILAPTNKRISRLRNIRPEPELYSRLLAGMQRLRGTAYLKDGAIQASDLSGDGRHQQSADRKSWHILALSRAGHVTGAVRCRMHTSPYSFRNLGVVHSALAQSDIWGPKFRTAVERELAIAQSSSLAYFEVGGWAIAEEMRCTSEAIRIALSTYGLGQMFGGALGISTATTRHQSSNILRKLGGRSLTVGPVTLPDYFDPVYNCHMEILRFDASEPNPRYTSYIEDLRSELMAAPVFCDEVVQKNWNLLPQTVATPALASAY